MIDLILWPLVAAFVITGIHVYLGLHVVTRGVIFVDLALAQVAQLKRLYVKSAENKKLKEDNIVYESNFNLRI